MRGSSTISASAPTSATSCGSWRGSISDTEYVLLCREPDLGVAAQLGPNFRARRSNRRPTTRCASRFTCRWVLRRERPDVYHAPHYVLPPAVRVPLGRDDPRLHPPDVSAVPAEPRGAMRTRAASMWAAAQTIAIAS